MTAQEVIGELRRLHPTEFGEWAFFTEQFSIDAYAIRLWGATGDKPYRRVAYEVKVSRSDFLSELKRPEKRAGAMEISHQFYFAMPAELAERCLPDVAARAPECGLLAIHDEALTLEQRDRSGPCKGAGWAPCVKILRRAPLRECRGFTDYQIIGLIRKADREPGIDEARHQAKLERERANAAKRRAEAARKEAEGLRDRLHAVGIPAVVPGSSWSSGPWTVSPRSTVVHVEDQRWGLPDRQIVVLEDATGGRSRIEMWRFLADWSPVPATPARPVKAEDQATGKPAGVSI